MLQGAPADDDTDVGECRGARTRLCGGPVDTSVRRRGSRTPPDHPVVTNKNGIGRPLPHRTPHRRLAQVALGAGRARLLIALLGLAPGEASEATKPWAALVRAGAYPKRPPISPAADPIAIVKKNSAAPRRARSPPPFTRARG